VIFNVFSITTAQRLRENALLRAIGASRRQVTTALLVEATIVGLLGSVLGFFTGIGLSRGLSALLAAFGVDIPTRGLSIEARTVIITLVVGTLVTIASAVFPALKAGRVPPLAALRDTAIENVGNNHKRFSIGISALVAGVIALVLAALGVNDWFLGVGVVAFFAGVLIIGPGVAKPVALALGRPVEWSRGVTGAMARQNAARNPKRTARTAAPVLIGVALVTAFTAFAASVEKEIRTTIGNQFNGDYAISAPSNGFGGLPISLTDEVALLPEVEQATGLGFATITLNGEGRFVQVLNPATASGLIDLDMVLGDQATLTANGIIVSNNRATTEGWQLGDALEIGLVDGTNKSLTIEGTFVPNGFFGSYVINRDVFLDTNNTLFDTIIYVDIRDGITDEQARVALSAVSSDRGLGTLLSRQEFIDAQSGQINQILGLIYGLLALSIVIAVVGIVITLLLSVFERKREIGLLRAVGMTRSQVRTTVRWESVITSMFGAVVGVVLGIVMGLVLIVVLADNGLSAFSLPISGTLVILVLSFVIGVLAAVYPAWKATRVNIMQSISTT
jgi:putative ABC transport system permease protein